MVAASLYTLRSSPVGLKTESERLLVKKLIAILQRMLTYKASLTEETLIFNLENRAGHRAHIEGQRPLYVVGLKLQVDDLPYYQRSLLCKDVNRY